MKKLKVLALALVCAVFSPAKADEGMWLLQLMQEQNLADRMKAQGLKMDIMDIYNPDQITLKDAVGIFGRGCTGEIISPNGLILTNHHCGYDAIQQHSSVEHDYLTDGFWAKSYQEELPTPGLTFKFVDRIVDVTEKVNEDIRKGKVTEAESFGSKYLKKLAADELKKSDLKGKPGISTQALPFYEGNKFYLFFIKTYSDVRMVAAPPSSIGKFGGETDNWMWPRHTGDFSMFRIYADKDGNPAEYSAENVPLKVKKHLTISLKGLQEGDYAMIMGFPGSTSRYLTESEVRLRMEGINVPRITVREERQNILRKEMAASDKVRIQYASKFAGSSNYWKKYISMNKAIVDNKVLETKAEQEAKFAAFAKEKQNADYAAVVGKIDEYVKRVTPLRTQLTYFTETFRSGIEFTLTSKMEALQDLATALQKNKKKDVEKAIATLKEAYADIHNKDYDHEVDRKVAKVLLPLYAEKVPAEALPDFYQTVKNTFKGDYNAYVDTLYNNSIFANEKNFNAFIENPTVEAINKDLSAEYAAAVSKKYKELAASCPNITFHESGLVDAKLLNSADVLLSDASSVIVEAMMLDKPVVTYCNTMPGAHLLNVTETDAVEGAIEKAISRPAELMERMRAYVHKHEAHLDGESSSRVLDAVNNYIWYFQGKTRAKPWNLVRKFKLRWRVGYPLMATLRLW